LPVLAVFEAIKYAIMVKLTFTIPIFRISMIAIAIPSATIGFTAMATKD